MRLKKLKTNKGLFKTIFLSIITLGIYSLVVMTSVSNDINTVAARYDRKKTMYFCLLAFIVSPITLGIASFVWYHKVSNRIGNELRRRDIAYRFAAKDFWLWGILGSIIFVGPYVYIHKLFKAVNKLNAHYNDNELALIENDIEKVDVVDNAIDIVNDEANVVEDGDITVDEANLVDVEANIAADEVNVVDDEANVTADEVNEADNELNDVETGVVEEKPFVLKRRFYERAWFWVIYSIVIGALLVFLIPEYLSNSSSSSNSDYDYNYNYNSGYASSYNTYVYMIKEATHSSYGITYGKAFDSFFASPSWRHFKSTENLDVVEFTGIFSYGGSPATAKIQFVLDLSNGTFNAYYLEINDVSQSRLTLATLISKVFESYY